MPECNLCSGSGCSPCCNSGQAGITYQIGALLDFRGSDIEVADLPAAQLQAGKLMDADWNSPIGIWTGQQHGSELVEIWYQGGQFRS